jgi:hypothetical protein
MSTAASEILPVAPAAPVPAGPGELSLMVILSAMTPWIAGLHPGNLRGAEPGTTLLLGAFITASCWCAARIWQATIRNAFHSRGAIRAAVSQLPFWFLGGGIGYCTGIVCLKAWGAVDVQDNPFRPMFIAGAETGIIVSGILTVLSRYHSKLTARITAAFPGKGTRHDESGTAQHHRKPQ